MRLTGIPGVLGALVVALLVVAPRSAAGLEPAPGIQRRETGSLILEGVPEIPEALVERMRQYRNTRGAAVGGWLPDGSGVVITTRFAETAQLHVVRQPMGARRQLTFFTEPVRGAAVHPERQELLFLKDRGGDEFAQIHRFDLATGTSEALTSGRYIHRAVTWDRAGGRFAYLTNRRTGRDWEVMVADAADPSSARVLVAEPGFWIPGEFSPDDRRLLVYRAVSADESELHIVDLETGERRRVSPRVGVTASIGSAAWAEDGRHVWVVSNEDDEFDRLAWLDPETGAREVLTKDLPGDVEGLAITRRGDRLAFAVNVDGLSSAYLMDAATRNRRELAALPVGLVGGLDFDPAGERLAMTVNTPRSPSDVYVVDVAGGGVERWTESEIGGLNPEGFVEPELIRYPTFDEVGGRPREIPAFLYLPPGPGPHPVVIDIHGGPEAQARPSFSSTIQYLVQEMGIAVLEPNVRGSSGYGRTYLNLDNGRLREDAVRDIGALLDWIAAREDLDASRVAVTGGSYGGYMVYASMVHHGDRLRCGVSVVGISSFLTFLESTEAYRRDLRRVEYGDERDPEMRAFLERISPLTHAARIRRPMLIAQGANDPRVPASEAEQMRDTIRAQGGEVWYFLAKDEGHGFAKKPNADAFVQVQALFLERYLLGGAGE